ncbi:hypothetical protein [Deinococcus cellulosilyticus]|uniref:Uncharacterized protein n=1 Tax=Deinococcus cellulosilyticus (strain DSM 18568 / NBRC 106333 / KACC 11606 / 5516J-15) TaxID=1223518 RepID=A0A511N483_DEIC1|nr:hypothetical protein [Deinococcus cellulosilyticus]GEM47191.1 hypothetical protein DC3_28260 [Deinococcus cellulosilyticus NBRC 106333 = KACC 11606]
MSTTQPLLFAPAVTADQVFQHLQAHTAWWAVWTFVEVLQKNSPTPLKSKKAATLWVLKHYTEDVIRNLQKGATLPSLIEACEDRHVLDLAAYISEHWDVLKAGGE